MRIVVASLNKLVRRPASFVTMGLMIGLILLVFLAVGASARQLEQQEDGAEALLLVTFPIAYLIVLGFILQLGGLLAVVYGAAIAGSEWTWGTLKSAVARGEARSWYLLATFIAIVLVIGVALIVSYLIGVGAAYVGAGLAQVPTDGLDDRSTLGELPAQLARSWVVLSEQAAIGYAVATVARSQLAGIGVGIAAYFGEGFASLFISDVTKWLPFSAAGAALPAVGQGNGQIVSNLSADTALLVVAAWLVGALVVAALFTERAEIGG